MKICSFLKPGSSVPELGVFSSDGIAVHDLTALDPVRFSSFSSLVRGEGGASVQPDVIIRAALEKNARDVPTFPLDEVTLVIPFTPSEIWAAGVTYLRSTQAREIETSLKGLYNHVYDAKRPEIFFKTTGHRCVGPDQEVGIRGDSKWSVPEPELTLVFGEDCKVLGYTIGNDMSARDIEGENPLYLPQAKVYRKCCAIGPVVATPEEIPAPGNLKINMKILRKGSVTFEGSISTSQMKRTLEELLSYLKKYNSIPACSALMTGTGIVPPDEFSLIDGDVVEIEIQGIGKLRNIAKILS